MVAAGRWRRTNTFQLITASELKHLDEYKQRSKFCSMSNDLAKYSAATTELPMALASLENVESAPARQIVTRKHQTGPKFG